MKRRVDWWAVIDKSGNIVIVNWKRCRYFKGLGESQVRCVIEYDDEKPRKAKVKK